jgi:ubiquinone/menaquinone biosynthesis C-methylase UbiE
MSELAAIAMNKMFGTPHPCDLCGTESHLPLVEAEPYIGGEQAPVVCANCGFVYVKHRRSPAEIARSWDDIWGEGYTSEWPAVKARLEYVTEWCDQTFGWDGRDMLDIGAGMGTFLEKVRAKGGYPVGLEPDAANVKRIRAKDIACMHGTVETVTPGQYDVITILWTLENCGDCMDMLRRARAMLRRDGILVVATGSRILVPYKKPLSTYFSTNPADLHCFRWSEQTLKRALAEAGFETNATNDYVQNDVLVMMAKQAEVTAPGSFYDDPAAVVQYFRDWAEAFP